MRQKVSRWKERAARLRRELRAIRLACRHPRTPWYARVVAACTVAYAASPIDLIPDVIPVLGYLDDLLIVPAGLWLTLRLIPNEVMAECRARAAESNLEQGRWAGAVAAVVIIIWLIFAVLAVQVVRRFSGM